MNKSFNSFLFLLIAVSVLSTGFAQTSLDTVLQVTASTQSSSPYITLSWQTGTSATGQKLWRRVKGAATWETPVTLNTNATSYSDTSALPSVAYEYSIQRYQSTAPSKVYGSIVAGYNIPLVEQRGKVILLVDNTMTVPLTPELTQLQQDLAADGWQVIRHDVPREVVPPTSTNPSDYSTRFNEQKAIRDIVKSDYATDPTNTWTLLMVGRIPVPYSGYFNPDGHGDHYGAWPADAHYADVSGTWTDTSTLSATAVSDARNTNVAGDGKFDQITLPSNAKLIQCGRVDLSNMPSVPVGMTETALLRQYLVRDHCFRYGIAPYNAVQRRGLVDDNFGYLGGEAFASSGWRAGIDFFGSNSGQMDSLDWFFTLRTTPMLLAYGCGSGAFISADGVGSSPVDFGKKDSKAVFCMLFGSWFGDWDCQDNFLRAPLAGTANSMGLTDVWSGRGYFHLYHMALGETIGYCVKYTQNSPAITGDGDWQQDGFANYIHYALMGDPTLRLHTVKPPTLFSASLAANGVSLSWTASADSVTGYHVYRATTISGPFTRLTGKSPSALDPMGSPLATTTYTDTTAVGGMSYIYQVKAVKMETSPSGCYANQSHGQNISFIYQGDSSTPVIPTRLAVVGAGTGTYALKWVDNANNETGYIIQRLDPTTGTWNQIVSLPPNTTSYTDTTAPVVQISYYRVQATGSGSPSGYTDAVADYNFPGLFSVSPSFLVYSKSSGTAILNTVRTNGTQGAVSINYSTSTILGAAGADYTSSSGTLNWAHGDGTAKTLNVPIVNRTGTQLTKIVQVNYTNPTNGLTIGVPTTSFFNIRDDAALTLPSPWTSQAMGTTYYPGYAEYANNTFGLCAQTGYIGGTNDSLRFLYQAINGDCQLTARVSFLSTSMTGNMRVGLMLRASLNTNSSRNSVLMASEHTVLRNYRSSGGAAADESVSQSSLAWPCWLRIKRTGTSVSVYQSADNVAWTQLGSAITLSGLGSTAYVGFVVGTNTTDVTQLTTLPVYGQIDNVTVTTTSYPVVGNISSFNVATGVNAGEINLNWSTATGAATYQIERSTLSNSGFTIVATTNDPIATYTNSGLIANTTYYYRVMALNPGNSSAYTPVMSAQPFLPADITGWRYLYLGTTSGSGFYADNVSIYGDGLPNLVKYALGLSPYATASSGGTIVQSQSVSGANYLTCTLTRWVNSPDITFTVEAANNISGPWTTIDPTLPANQVNVQNNTPSTGVQTIVVKDVQPLSASTTRFMRTRVISATNNFTTPLQGMVSLPIQSGNGTAGRYNFLYAPLHSPANASGSLRGRISSLTSNTITSLTSNWTSSQLASSTAPMFVKISSGTAAGHTFRITANTSGTLTVDTQGLDLTTLGIATTGVGLLTSDTYEIFSGDTILSLFGTPGSNNPLVGGTSPNGAVDQIILNTGGVWVAYYFNTTAGTWRQGNSPTDRGNTYIRPDSAFIYNRVGTAPMDITLWGEAPIVQHKTVANTNGLTALASYFPIVQTIGSLNLQNLPNWKKVGDSGITSTNADQLILNNNSAWGGYYYNSTAGQWRQGNSPNNKSNTVIPLGAGLLLQRSGTTGTGVITLPLPYTP